MEIIKYNELVINQNKIIVYDHTHGAYLAYLCYFFAPNLFSLMIDNSAWLFPVYLKSDRYVYQQVGRVWLWFLFILQ